MQVQLRSEAIGLKFADTVAEAMKMAKADDSIWKISFDAKNGERVRLVRQWDDIQDITYWVYDPIWLDLGNEKEGESRHGGIDIDDTHAWQKADDQAE